MPRATSPIAALLLAALLGSCGGKSGARGDGGADGTDASEASDATMGRDGPAADATLASGLCVAGAFRQQGGVCRCQAGIPDVCASVCPGTVTDDGKCVLVFITPPTYGDLAPACVDLQTDPNHCGTCAIRCAPSAACVGGVCGPSPTTLVPSPSSCGAMRLAASAGTLYWTDTKNGAVVSVPEAGGVPQAISGTETTAPTFLAVKGQTVFWLDGKTIVRRAGGAISLVTTSADEIRGLTASDDAATVYFSSGSKIQSVAAAGGPTTDIVLQDSGGLPAGLALQGNLMAFTIDVLGGIDIAQVGPVPARCWTENPDADEQTPELDVNCDRLGYDANLNPEAIVIGGGKVFWTDDTQVRMNDFNAHAPQQRDTVANANDGIRSIAFSNGHVFFADSDGNSKLGQIQKVTPVIDGQVTPLARNVDAPGSIAVDGKRVFWVTGGCAIQTTPTGD